MSESQKARTCLVIGAGISGLLAAGTLQRDGWDVTVLDKGRGVGGRMATRRVGGGTFDHGAQFFTVRSEPFTAFVDDLLAEGVAYEWCRGFEVEDGFPRYAIRGGMDQLAAHLAGRLGGAEVRAGRRHKEVADLDYESVAADMARRDTVDAERSLDPLRVADDAVVIDTTALSVDEVVDDLLSRL